MPLIGADGFGETDNKGDFFSSGKCPELSSLTEMVHRLLFKVSSL